MDDCDCGDCLGGCGEACVEAGCEETDCNGYCCYSTNPTNCCRSRSTDSCYCCFDTLLTAIAVATLITILLVSYVVVFPARVTVEDAYLHRLELANANGTSLAYDVSLAVAVRNRDFGTGVWKTAPLDAQLRFRGQTFARASAQLESAEWGIFRSRGTGVYRVTMASAAAAAGVALGGDGVAEFVRESVAGVFVVVGGQEHHHGVVRATCPLKLSPPTATDGASVAFTTVKCT